MKPEIGSTWKDLYGVVLVTDSYCSNGIDMVAYLHYPATYPYIFKQSLNDFIKLFYPCNICKTCKKVY